MVKKILIILLIIIIITIIIYFIWQKFENKKNNQTNLENIEKQTKEETISKNLNELEQKDLKNQEKILIKKINTDSKVINYWLYQDNIFYLNPKGEVYKKENDQSKKITNFYESMSFIRGYQSPNNEKVLIAFNNPYRPKWLIFDNLDLTWRPLPENIVEANWLNANEIIAILNENNDYKLVKITDYSNIQLLINNFNFFDFYIYPITSKKIVIQEKPSSNKTDIKIFTIDLETKEIKKIDKIDNNEILVKPITQDLFLRYTNSNNLIIDLNNYPEKIILKTLIDKCCLDIKNNSFNFYCFVSVNNDNFDFDNYYQKEIKLLDKIITKIEINKNNNLIEVNKTEFNLNQINNQIKIDAIKPTILNDKIYFINNYDNNLYEISLKDLIEENEFNQFNFEKTSEEKEEEDF